METDALFTPYIDRLAQQLPQGEAREKLCFELNGKLQYQYLTLLAEGMEEREAFGRTLFEFGSTEALETILLNMKLNNAYTRFKRRYPKMIRYGFAAILVVPIIFLVLMFNLDAKLTALVCWILSIIACATFLIVVEYTNYHYQELVTITPDQGIAKLCGVLLQWLKSGVNK